MLLVLQIAAGIVLGWYVITHWEKLRELSSVALGWLVGLGVLFAVILGGGWAVSSGWQFVTLHPDRVKGWIGGALCILLVVLCCTATGMLALRLFPRLRGKNHAVPEVQLSDKEQTRRVERTLMVGMFIGMANVFLCAALIGDQTLPIFGVWSRANGFADTGEMMSAALLGQWAWIPLAAIFWRQWRAARKIVQGQ